MLRICIRRRIWYPETELRLQQKLQVWSLRDGFVFTRAFTTSETQLSRDEIVPLRKRLKDEAKVKKASAIGFGPPKSRAKLDARLKDWELTVGIEIHAQLNTARKLFSEATTFINAPPNTRVAPFDLAVPGSQPVFQIATLLPALRAAIALNCSVELMSKFDRKHYFYHDQPAGYQITQYYEPFARDGKIRLSRGDGLGADDGDEMTIGIKQIQMEQDTAKSQEQDEETTLIDFNRAGQPLIEIISLPHLHSPEAAAAYVKKVQAILLSVNAVTTGMEMGGLRADINVSVRRRNAEPGIHQYSGVTGLGQRTEIKNLSTLKGVEDAIRAERDRQIDVLEAGGIVEGETRGWSLAKPNETRLLRGKEGEVDYRYMPDPDIPPLYISQEVVAHLKQTLPKLPDELFAMLTDSAQYDLSPTDAKILLSIDEGDRLDYFQDVVYHLEWISGYRSKRPLYGKAAGNWLLHELGSLFSTANMIWTDNRVPAEALARLINQLLQKNITGNTAKQILKMVFEGDERNVEEIISHEGLAFRPLSENEYEILAKTVMSEHEDVVRQIREKGRTGKLMFLVGQVMRRDEEGRVEAKTAEKVLRGLVMEESI